MNNRYITALILLCACCHLFAQQNKTVRDSMIIIRDSVVYNSVDSASTRNTGDSTKYRAFQKLTEGSKLAIFLHKALFRSLGREIPPPLYEGQRLESAFHAAAQGKIIRKIVIITLDPFGNNIRDTSEHPHTLIFKTGNALHFKTNTPVIKNLLLLQENQVYDSLIAKESARLLRSHDYIRDIYFTVKGTTSDSVDLEFRVMDVWSLIPFLRLKSTETGIGLSDLNFAGTGSRLELTGWWKKDGGNITHVSYLMPNFRNSYISLNVQFLFSPGGNLMRLKEFGQYFYSPVSSNPQYMFSRNNNIVRSIEINRPFYSPVAKWAGGIFLGQIMTTQNWLDIDTFRVFTERTNIQDFWGGRSWLVGRDKPDERITSFVLSGRYVHTVTPEISAEAANAGLFPSHNYFFGSVSISSRKYFRDRYIFNYGKVEDVPSGRIAGITFGEDFQERSRLYLGLYAGLGGYYRFGYLSTFLSYGTFKSSADGFQQGILTGRITYFTRLMSFGDWRIRQFIRPTFVFGINKSPADNQPLNVGIKGFEAIESRASSLSIVSLQTQTYAPWDIAGFHFGPYFFAHIGLLGEQPVGAKGRLYSLFGLGMLIKNDYLMFSTFQLSFSFYPYIPADRYNILKTNAYKTTDYGFRDFEVTKPGIVE